MGLDSCPKCWDALCCCGEMYKCWDTARILDLIKVLQDLVASRPIPPQQQPENQWFND